MSGDWEEPRITSIRDDGSKEELGETVARLDRVEAAVGGRGNPNIASVFATVDDLMHGLLVDQGVHPTRVRNLSSQLRAMFRDEFAGGSESFDKAVTRVRAARKR